MATSPKSRRKAASPIAEAQVEVPAVSATKPTRKQPKAVAVTPEPELQPAPKPARMRTATAASETAVKAAAPAPKAKAAPAPSKASVKKPAAKKPAAKKAVTAKPKAMPAETQPALMQAPAGEVPAQGTPAAARKAARTSTARGKPAPAPEVAVDAEVQAASPVPRKKAATRKTKAAPVAVPPALEPTPEPAEVAAPAAAPRPAYSVLSLDQGLERRLSLEAAEGAPAALRLPEAGLPLGQQVQGLLEAAAAAGHELRVADEVWLHLAQARDAEARVLRLEAAYPEGQGLAELLKAPLHGFQWEAALFAVCAGRALLADDLGLSQRAAALAAWQVATRQFGLTQGLLVAPLERHARWLADAERLLGGWPAELSLQTPQALRGDEAVDCLIVDAVQDQTELDRLRRVEAPWLWLLADRELLGDAQLDPLVDWLDAQRQGPLARLRALGSDASKRLQREALQTVMLSRRKRDLGLSVPVLLDTAVWTPGEAVTLDPQARAQVQATLQRWQRLGYLSQPEQLQLLAAVQTLRGASTSPAACESKLQALVNLLPELMPAMAQKLVVAVQQDSTAMALAQGLSALGLAVASLRCDQTAAQRAIELARWRDEQGQVLLAVDAACQGLDLSAPATALVHGDLPWNPAQLTRRVSRVAGGARGLLVWQLLQTGSLDAGLAAAQQGHAEWSSANLDAEPAAQPFLSPAELPRFMAALQAALAGA